MVDCLSWLLVNYYTRIKEPADGFSVGVFPKFYPLVFAESVALVELVVARITKGCYSVVVCLDASALTVSQLIAVRCDYGSVFDAAIHAGCIAD